jgi:hypothetical protein
VKRALPVLLFAILVIAAMLVWGLRKSSHETATAEEADRAVSAMKVRASQAPPNDLRQDPRRATAVAVSETGIVDWPDAASITEELNAPERSAGEDMQIVHSVLGNYARVFGEMPPGGLNEELVGALRGDNPKNMRFLVVSNSELSGRGELLDRWGTAYFFHKLSGQVVELRSAGPDRKMWTGDDVYDESAEKPPL